MSAQPSVPTVLITGGGSGIGAGLASAFHKRGAIVIIAGKTAERLREVATRHPGMEVEVVDVGDADQVQALAARVSLRHPNLSVLINNAGIQTLMDFSQPAPIDPAVIAREIDVNFKGLILFTNAFLPLLSKQPSARLIHVGSGLGFIPLAAAPVYSATKAAVHSFTISLRRQLAGSNINVIEIIPPIVETDLHRNQGGRPPGAMKLGKFVAAAMAGIDTAKPEIRIGLAKVLGLGSRIAPGFFLNVVNKARG
jgi:uncharacterized oxidoreductase